MQIQSAKQEELGLIIRGLRSFHIIDVRENDIKERLLKQMENELLQRYGLVLREPA